MLRVRSSPLRHSAVTSFTELAALAADPERVAHVASETLPRLIGEAETLRALLWAEHQARAVRTVAPKPERNGGQDRLLTAAEAAEQLGVSRRWVYRKADRLPFTKRLGAGTLRFSERGLQKWQARK